MAGASGQSPARGRRGRAEQRSNGRICTLHPSNQCLIAGSSPCRRAFNFEASLERGGGRSVRTKSGARTKGSPVLAVTCEIAPLTLAGEPLTHQSAAQLFQGKLQASLGKGRWPERPDEVRRADGGVATTSQYTSTCSAVIDARSLARVVPVKRSKRTPHPSNQCLIAGSSPRRRAVNYEASLERGGGRSTGTKSGARTEGLRLPHSNTGPCTAVIGTRSLACVVLAKRYKPPSPLQESLYQVRHSPIHPLLPSAIF